MRYEQRLRQTVEETLDALGVESFTLTEARRRLSKAVQVAKSKDGLPKSAPAEVQTRTNPAFNPNLIPERNKYDDLIDFVGSVQEAPKFEPMFRRHGALIDVAVYRVTGIGCWADRELVDVYTVWMGNEDEGPRVRVSLKGWYDEDGTPLGVVYGEDYMSVAYDEAGEVSA